MASKDAGEQPSSGQQATGRSTITAQSIVDSAQQLGSFVHKTGNQIAEGVQKQWQSSRTSTQPSQEGTRSQGGDDKAPAQTSDPRVQNFKEKAKFSFSAIHSATKAAGQVFKDTLNQQQADYEASKQTGTDQK